MTKDEALAFDLALEALKHLQPTALTSFYTIGVRDKAITAIKQARALDKMAENARELGLDYEPAGGTQVSKVWWDGEKLMAKPIPLEDIYQPAPVPEPVAFFDPQGKGFYWAKPTKITAPVTVDVEPLSLYTTPPAAQRQWVSLTEDEVTICHSLAVLSKKHDGTDPSFTTLLHQQIEAKLKELNT
jgi:hypothetical protein